MKIESKNIGNGRVKTGCEVMEQWKEEPGEALDKRKSS